jgi:hypothetical protein
MNTTRIQNFENFCKSSATNVEIMEKAVRQEVTVQTSLDDVIAIAIQSKKSIVLTGTAGSGKTHLIETIGEPTGYTVCRDLADSVDMWSQLLKPNEPCIVAGNEGALLKGAENGHLGFRQAVEILHRIQKGEEVSDGNLVVIDVAGFDPVGNHTLKQILQLPLLTDYILDKNDAWKKDAWNCLKSEKVRTKICNLLESVSSESDGFTFRQLWQLIAEMMQKGSEVEGTWFHILINGNNHISKHVKEFFKLSDIPMTHYGNKFWYGDILDQLELFETETHEIIKRIVSQMLTSETDKSKYFNYLRILSFFALKESRDFSSTTNDWKNISNGKVDTIINLINRYMTYGLLSLGSGELLLWFEHATERRQEKPDTIFAIGKAASNDFEIRRSNCVANCGGKQVVGGRKILVHKPTGATLLLTKELVEGIGQTRSFKSKDRRHVEYDWRICHFMSEVSEKVMHKDRIIMAKFDFKARKGNLTEWEINDQSVRRVEG